MAKKEQKIKTEFDNFWGDRIKEILDGSQVESIEDFVSREIEEAQQLSEVSNDPSYYLGKVSAYQDLRDHLNKIIEYYNKKYRDYKEFRFDDLSDALRKIEIKDRQDARNKRNI
jgi:hypothetical protein